MAEFPAIPLWTDAFIADTVHLNAAQTGAYLMLLMCAWRTKDCALPDDDAQLARFSRMTKAQWKKNKDVIMAFWEKNDEQKWIQLRLNDERKSVLLKRESASRAGAASALKRKERHSTAVKDTLQQNANHHTHTTYPKHNNPQTPLGKSCSKNDDRELVNKSLVEGVLKNGIGGVGVVGGYRVQDRLSDDAWQDARAHAPGWDINQLASVYNEGINSGKRESPKYPNKAFPVWCKKYTKGHPPK